MGISGQLVMIVTELAPLLIIIIIVGFYYWIKGLITQKNTNIAKQSEETSKEEGDT